MTNPETLASIQSIQQKALIFGIFELMILDFFFRFHSRQVISLNIAGECNCLSGWKGVTCNSQCNDGTWGENCLKSCDCNNQGSCDQQTGACICYPGYTGDSCTDGNIFTYLMTQGLRVK